jgi:hypothetical protein
MNASLTAKILALSFMAGAVAGCRVGSFERAQSGTYCGWVIDSQSERPVSGARVELVGTLTSSSESDAEGYFFVGPLKCKHYGAAGGPDGTTTFRCNHAVGENLALKVSRAGYTSCETLVPAHTVTNWNTSTPITVGRILLQRQPLSQP